MTNNPLLMLRERISTPDLKLLALLAERHELAVEVGMTKHQATLSPSPAHPRIRGAIAGCADQCRQAITALIVFYHPSVSTNYRRFGANPAISLYLLQHQLNQISWHAVRIAFLGPKGSYSHLAARQHAARHFDQLRLLKVPGYLHSGGNRPGRLRYLTYRKHQIRFN